MKKYIFYELAKHASRNVNHHQKQRWLKKLKYLAAFAFVGTLLLGGLAIWGTVAVVSSIAGSVNQGVVQESVVKGQEGLKAIISQPITTRDCIDSMKRVLTPTTLLTVPLAKNINAIRSVCWDKSKTREDQKQS